MSHNIPFLKGQKIYLRGLQIEDASGNYQKWFNDQEVCQYNTHGIFPMNENQLIDFITATYSSRNTLVLAIVSIEENIHIGNVSLQNIDWIARTAEFAIIIGEKAFWNKGVGLEAAKLIIQHGFNTLNLNRIYCGTSSENFGMQTLAKKLNMTEEGFRRKALFKNNQYNNIIEYGLLKEEYKA